jgi:ribosome maturation factor RimP
MAAQPATAEILAVIRPAAERAGLDLEGVEVVGAGRRPILRILVDKDGGVGLDDIAGLTTRVGRELDDSDVMGDRAYTLEVTSPGVDRPLTEPRHWRRNVGRLVTVAVGPAGSADEVTGRITAAVDEGVTLAVEAKGKPGAKKRPPTPVLVPWAQLGPGRVQVEFGRAEPGEDADDHPQPDDEPDPAIPSGGGQ